MSRPDPRVLFYDGSSSASRTLTTTTTSTTTTTTTTTPAASAVLPSPLAGVSSTAPISTHHHNTNVNNHNSFAPVTYTAVPQNTIYYASLPHQAEEAEEDAEERSGLLYSTATRPYIPEDSGYFDPLPPPPPPAAAAAAAAAVQNSPTLDFWTMVAASAPGVNHPALSNNNNKTNTHNGSGANIVSGALPGKVVKAAWAAQASSMQQLPPLQKSGHLHTTNTNSNTSHRINTKQASPEGGAETEPHVHSTSLLRLPAYAHAAAGREGDVSVLESPPPPPRLLPRCLPLANPALCAAVLNGYGSSSSINGAATSLTVNSTSHPCGVTSTTLGLNSAVPSPAERLTPLTTAVVFSPDTPRVGSDIEAGEAEGRADSAADIVHGASVAFPVGPVAPVTLGRAEAATPHSRLRPAARQDPLPWPPQAVAPPQPAPAFVRGSPAYRHFERAVQVQGRLLSPSERQQKEEAMLRVASIFE